MDDERWLGDKVVLVLDLGGGTFDVSLLKISKSGEIDVKAVGGDTHLGGEDFDRTLVDYCIKEFKKKHGEDIRGNPRALGRLKVACEKAKKDLSSATFAPIEIDCLHEGNDFSIKISRAKFEELNSCYFEKCMELVKICLLNGGMDKKNVDVVVLVGGSTRIPKVQRLVEEFFDGKTIYKSMNGDEAVAFGAAILAAKLSENHDNVGWDVVLQDVTPLSLGIEIHIEGVRGYMSVVIPRNTSIPTIKKQTYHKPVNDKTLSISVYQGECKEVKDNLLLGEFSFPGVTPGSELEVCFSIDANGILLVSAKEVSTGKTKSITITKY